MVINLNRSSLCRTARGHHSVKIPQAPRQKGGTVWCGTQKVRAFGSSLKLNAYAEHQAATGIQVALRCVADNCRNAVRILQQINAFEDD